ncbi:carbamoyl phosphate synthase small subunit [Clostridium mediterraneense]|uniref:carbamoyl phosphate synthase small subunit n=1 Tax=Clostridium mediterraneense TaxID=1805472 RepID=UPI00082DB490|nr:carbamoyl phosphate synthase small subunit [Clostridium mediterraneense]
MKAKLILEDGTIFEGKAFGYLKEAIGEVVFTTSIAGYQEVITDPSYHGQIVTMTYPLIGNYGINLEDIESDSVQIKGLIVKEKCSFPNNFRCELELDYYLKHNKILGLEDIDTRALTKLLRNKGSMKGLITLDDFTLSEVEEKIARFSNADVVKEVSTKEAYRIEGAEKKVAILDLGIKNSVLSNFIKRGCDITIFPYNTKAEEILNINPDVVFLSNGPGNPEDIKEISKEIAKLSEKMKISAIGLGHQLLAIAMGGKTSKLDFGHRGSNHPVKDLNTGRVYITSQSQGYYVSEVPEAMEVIYKNVNDSTVAGLKHKELDLLSVQFVPSGDSEFIFDEFLK